MSGQLGDERDRVAVASEAGNDLLDRCSGEFSEIETNSNLNLLPLKSNIFVYLIVNPYFLRPNFSF